MTPAIVHLLVSSHVHLIAQLPSSSGFNIYCTSNLDGTGACNRVDNNQSIDCLVIPGGVIDCKQPGETPIQCVLYSSILDSQAYFYCTRRTDPGVRTNRIKTDRFDTDPNPAPDPSLQNAGPTDPLPPVIVPTGKVLKSPFSKGFD